jgi:hypothetical protein
VFSQCLYELCSLHRIVSNAQAYQYIEAPILVLQPVTKLVYGLLAGDVQLMELRVDALCLELLEGLFTLLDCQTKMGADCLCRAGVRESIILAPLSILQLLS